MSQTSYQVDFDAGFPGLSGDSGPADLLTRSNGTAGAFGLGLAVKEGAAANEFAAYTSGSTVLGVTRHEHTAVEAGGSLAVDQTASILTKGRIWVQIDQTVAIGDPVFVRHTAGTAGIFRKDADTANASALPGAKWVKGGTAAEGVALLDLNLPQ